MYNSIVYDKPGWRNHPERQRWTNHVPALISRHNAIAEEMINRGYSHKSLLPEVNEDEVVYPKNWQSVRKMKKILSMKQGRDLESSEE